MLLTSVIAIRWCSLSEDCRGMVGHLNAEWFLGNHSQMTTA